MYFVELTVPWGGQEVFERKKLKYSVQEQGCSAKIYPVEVGCPGFVTTSTVKLVRALGISGQATKEQARWQSGAASGYG